MRGGSIHRTAIRLGIVLGVLSLLGIATIVGVTGIARQKQSPPPSPPVSRLAPFALGTCRGSVRHAEIEVESELLLHRELLTPEQLRNGQLSEEALLAAATQQLRYAFAANQHDPDAAHLLVPAGPPHRIERTTKIEVPYGRELALDWPQDPDVKPAIEYVKRALKRRVLRAEDQALRLGYRARLRVAWCAYGGREPGPLVLPVPADPYLLYWHVAKSQRKEQVYGKKRALSFPCADSEIADYEHPEFLWYYWEPHRRDPDCPALLGRALFGARLRVLSAVPAESSLRRLQRVLRDPLEGPMESAPVLRIAAIFGYVDHQAERPAPAHVLKCLSALRQAKPKPERKEPEDEDEDELCPDSEWGTEQYVRFLHELRTTLTQHKEAIEIRDTGLVATVTGLLPRSGRRVEIRAALTETDFLVPAPLKPRHVPLLLDALQTSDALIYAGHSGLGLNLAAAQLAQGASVPQPASYIDKLLRGSPVRLLGFLGCYTFSYFGQDLADRLGRDAGRDPVFVHTATAVSQLARAALQVLSSLDCVLAAQEGAPASRCAMESAEGDFLIFDHSR